MSYVAQETVTKDGVIFSKGEAVVGLSEAEATRLLELGAIAEGTPAEPGQVAETATQNSQSILDRAKSALGNHGQPSADQVARDADAADGRQV